MKSLLICGLFVFPFLIGASLAAGNASLAGVAIFLCLLTWLIIACYSHCNPPTPTKDDLHKYYNDDEMGVYYPVGTDRIGHSDIGHSHIGHSNIPNGGRSK